MTPQTAVNPDPMAILRSIIGFTLEGYLTEELLRQDAGIVVGFVLGHPEVFKSNGGN